MSDMTIPPITKALQKGDLRLYWQGLVKFAVRSPIGAFCGLVVLALIFIAMFATALAPYDPVYQIGGRMESPNSTYLLGTDQWGRDILSRVIVGSRVSIYVGFMSVILGVGIGATIGIASGYCGGMVDLISQRFMDVLMAIPGLVLAIATVLVLGPGLNTVVIAISVGLLARATRVTRGSTISVKENTYVLAAKALGAGPWRIMRYHVLPNVTAPILVLATAVLASAILAEASLSFLGLGVLPPAPTWGNMMALEARQYFAIAPWMALAPGIAISVAVLAFNLLGDTLRDVWDPRLRGSK